ncbi:MAG TPA: hypothetical protein PKV73_14955 [Agriterribacter sp.]|nr:hypothetical protein [Chitinophagaceae bacterium]HRP33195.1 hypothetical protein [Agriterribacter sp.]
MRLKKLYTPVLRYGFILLSLSVIFTTNSGLSCKKDDQKNKISTNVTEQDLMSTNGKRWMVTMVTLTTYNTAGEAESKEDKIIEDNIGVWFGDNAGVNGLNKTFTASEPLLEYFPELASWSLNTTRQTITLTCAPGYCASNKSGEWQINAFMQRENGGGYIGIERTISVPNGNKQKQEMLLFLA